MTKPKRAPGEKMRCTTYTVHSRLSPLSDLGKCSENQLGPPSLFYVFALVRDWGSQINVPKTGWAITHQLVPVVAFGSSGTCCLSLVGGLPGLVLSLAGEAEAEDPQP